MLIRSLCFRLTTSSFPSINSPLSVRLSLSLLFSCFRFSSVYICLSFSVCLWLRPPVSLSLNVRRSKSYHSFATHRLFIWSELPPNSIPSSFPTLQAPSTLIPHYLCLPLHRTQSPLLPSPRPPFQSSSSSPFGQQFGQQLTTRDPLMVHTEVPNQRM